ncbi:MAG TPA: mandelate racemase/muconate lactonizing enzyme family protein [Chloroflexota bacterium]
MDGDRLKVASLETIRVRADLSEPRGPSMFTYRARETLFIKLTTDDGLVGWGETYAMGGVRSALEDVLAPLLIGRDPLDARRLHQEMLSSTFGNGFAVGGVELALDDVRGKSLGVPVHVLYGGAVRTRVEAYASLPGYYLDRGPEDHWQDEVDALIARGFGGVKFRIGRFDPRREVALLSAIRKTVGPDLRLMADANAAYSPALALRAARALVELDFDWLEEPLPQSGYLGYPELRAKMDLPLAGGEGLMTRPAAHESLQRGCFDIVQPDVSICGGIAECLFIGDLARMSAVRCIPHCWAGGITLAATLHLAALLPEPSRMLGVDAPLLEYDVTENPFRDELVVGDPFALHDGSVDVPTAPGLGIDVDESALRRYTV